MANTVRVLAVQPFKMENKETGISAVYFYIPELRILSRNGLINSAFSNNPVGSGNSDKAAIIKSCPYFGTEEEYYEEQFFALKGQRKECLRKYIENNYNNLIKHSIPLPPNVSVDALEQWIDNSHVELLEPFEMALNLDYQQTYLEEMLPKAAYWAAVFVTVCGLAMALNGLTFIAAAVTILGVYISDQGMFGSAAKVIANDLDRFFSGRYKHGVGEFSYLYGLRSIAAAIASCLFSVSAAKDVYSNLVENFGQSLKTRGAAATSGILTGIALFICTWYETCDHFGWGFRDTRAKIGSIKENLNAAAARKCNPNYREIDWQLDNLSTLYNDPSADENNAPSKPKKPKVA